MTQGCASVDCGIKLPRSVLMSEGYVGQNREYMLLGMKVRGCSAFFHGVMWIGMVFCGVAYYGV